MRFTTPHGSVRYRLPWSWSAFDYRELCELLDDQNDARFETAKVERRTDDRRADRPRRAARAARRRRARLAAGARREPHFQPPEAPLSRGLEVHAAHDGSRRRAALLGRARPRAPRLRVERPGGRRGARRRRLVRPAQARQGADGRAGRARGARARALPGQLVPAPAARRRRTSGRSSPATRPATASRCRARGSAPRSTSASPPGARSRAVLDGREAAGGGARRLRGVQRRARAGVPPRAAPPAPRPGAAAARC